MNLNNLAFIGDRPAQLAALVLDAPVTYTADRANPFIVQRLVERYVSDLKTDLTPLITQRYIVLSTGLAWAPRYDGMVAKQINTLLLNSFLSPRIYVMPVSSRILLGHSINAKLRALCQSAQSRRDNCVFLGSRTYHFTHISNVLAPSNAPQPPPVAVQWCFEGEPAYPNQPTPTEVLALAQTLKQLHTSQS